MQFTSDQEAFIRSAIKSGRLNREEDTVKEALNLWEERERRRIEILAAVDVADASLERGEGFRVTTSWEAAQLAADFKKLGLTRLAAEQNAAR